MIHRMPEGIAIPGHLYDALGALRYITDAEDGEPLFVIRGRDALAVLVLQAYIQECHDHELNGQAMRAREHLNRFIEWQAENAKKTHLPDPLPNG